MTKRNRPLSPHVQVYRMPMAAVLSITHRMMGIVLTFGALLLVYMLNAAMYGEEAYATAQMILGSWLGRIVLLGVVFALWYHLVNGLRHLYWDTGRGLELEQLRVSGMVMLAVAGGMTLLTFVLAYAAGGA